MSVIDPFEGVFGQPQVRGFLRASVENGRVTHAYLFTGPAGSNKTLAAYALAEALICGCGECDACRKVRRRKHPDVHYYAPEGAVGYLVDQVRDIVADTALAPIQASSKVYIVDRVDLMNAASANAFLKTLEEPPDDVVLILLGRTRESVLPTIVSRCSVVPFRHIPATEAAGIIAQQAGVTPARARIGLAACDGSITKTIEFVKSNERMEFRKSVLGVMGRLASMDSWACIEAARELVDLAKAPLDEIRAAQEAEIRENEDFLAKSAIRRIEERNKKALTAKSLESLHQVASIAASFLRDVLAVCAQSPELVVNADVMTAIEEAASATDEARIARAIASVRACSAAISYNVSPETCFDALLFELKEALYGSRSPYQACI
ncbi:AAA family ATPase [Gordonibacter sp. Marseille-P4307]|uniref:DNA polymerase III subunit n=1 Tax=Gordonibacter sp. Marseille-P4307 TaxID=2161815 RepID=UPI000F549156|nr:AAA family ATPase [Gordonibacter sp. Marseille-P4307]